MNISTIQFKRILKYSGTSTEAIRYIREQLTPPLKNGEPLLVSYKDITEENYKYFIAIGIDENNRKIQISPIFNSIEDFNNYIEKHSLGVTSENLADDSDIIINKDTSGNYIVKVKTQIISADNINTTISSEEPEMIITQNQFNNLVWEKISEVNNNLFWYEL